MSIEAYQGGASVAQTVETFGRLAEQITATEFVPTSMRGKPAAVLACMMYGAELGLGPMQSLNSIQSIQGSVGLKPEGMRAMVTQRGHRIWPEDYSAESVTLCGWRNGDPSDLVVKVTWTMADARRAGLQGANWQKYPRAMLLARATSELCRLHFADVIGGLSYTPDEIADFDPPPSSHSAPVPNGYAHHIDADTETGDPFPDTPALSAAPSPVAPPVTRRRAPPVVDTGEKVDTKEAQRLHIKASSKTDPGKPLDETTLRVLIFGQTKGRTDSAAEVTFQEAGVIETRIAAARRGNLPTTFADRADEWVAWCAKNEAPAAAEAIEEPDLFAEVAQ